MQTKFATLVVAFVVIAACAFGQAPGEKLPIPDADAQRRATELAKDIFEADYKAAQSAEQKIALARKMLALGVATRNDPAGRYVLLRTSLTTAAGEGDLEVVELAVWEINKSFEVDELSTTAEALALAAKSMRGREGNQKLAERALAVMPRATKEDRYDLARQLAALAIVSAREAKNSDLVKRAQFDVAEAERLAATYGEVSDALLVLEKTPTDPDANLAAGRFYALDKGNWEKGLPMLALGSDAKLAELALLELDPPLNAQKRFELADAWWELAEQSEGAAALRLKGRAGYWYRRSVEQLTGLSKAKAQRRIEESSQADPAGAKLASVARPSPLPQEIELVGAAFGAGGRQADVTELVRAALGKDPFAPVQADDRVMGDPAPGTQKELTLAYRLEARKYSLTLRQTDVAAIPTLPPEGLRVRDASRDFQIIAARYGAGLTWRDVTPTLRQRLKDPAVPFQYTHENVAGHLDDPWFGVSKSTAVWFDYGGKRFVHIIKEGETSPLLP